MPLKGCLPSLSWVPETNPQTPFCSLIDNSLTTDKEDQFRDLFYIGVKHLTYNLEHIDRDKYQFQRSLISVANHARVDLQMYLLPVAWRPLSVRFLCVQCPSEEASCLQSQCCFLIAEFLVASSMSLHWFVLSLVSVDVCDSMLV